MGSLDLCGTSASEVPLNLLLRVSPRPSDIQIDILSAPSATFIGVPRYFVEPGDHTVFYHPRFYEYEADSK